MKAEEAFKRQFEGPLTILVQRFMTAFPEPAEVGSGQEGTEKQPGKGRRGSGKREGVPAKSKARTGQGSGKGKAPKSAKAKDHHAGVGEGTSADMVADPPVSPRAQFEDTLLATDFADGIMAQRGTKRSGDVVLLKHTPWSRWDCTSATSTSYITADSMPWTILAVEEDMVTRCRSLVALDVSVVSEVQVVTDAAGEDTIDADTILSEVWSWMRPTGSLAESAIPVTLRLTFKLEVLLRTAPDNDARFAACAPRKRIGEQFNSVDALRARDGRKWTMVDLSQLLCCGPTLTTLSSNDKARRFAFTGRAYKADVGNGVALPLIIPHADAGSGALGPLHVSDTSSTGLWPTAIFQAAAHAWEAERTDPAHGQPVGTAAEDK